MSRVNHDNLTVAATKVIVRVGNGIFLDIKDNPRGFFFGTISGLKKNICVACRCLEVDSDSRMFLFGFVGGNFFHEVPRVGMNIRAGYATDSAGRGVVKVKGYVIFLEGGHYVAVVQFAAAVRNFYAHGFAVQGKGVYRCQFGGFCISIPRKCQR